MAETTLSGLVGELGPRATFVGFLPAGSLAAFVGALLAAGAPGQAPDPGLLFDRAAELSVGEGGALLVGLVMVTVLTQPLQLPLVQLLEGYWSPGPIGRWGRARQRSRRTRLDRARRVVVPVAAGDEAAGDEVGEGVPSPTLAQQQSAYEAAWHLVRRYPPKHLVLPTALGNVLRAAEYRAGAPYGLDTVTAWPRLYALLGESTRTVGDDRRLQLDVAVRFSATFVVAAVVSGALLWPYGWWLTLAVGSVALAGISYRAAVAAATAYGESLEAAFDLHHLDLFRALHLATPTSTAAERKTAAAVNDLLSRINLDISLDYDQPPAS